MCPYSVVFLLLLKWIISVLIYLLENVLLIFTESSVTITIASLCIKMFYTKQPDYKPGSDKMHLNAVLIL